MKASDVIRAHYKDHRQIHDDAAQQFSIELVDCIESAIGSEASIYTVREVLAKRGNLLKLETATKCSQTQRQLREFLSSNEHWYERMIVVPLALLSEAEERQC